MPFLIDDIICRFDSTGILPLLCFSYPPFDLLWLVEEIRDHALREMYKPEEITDELKNNRMLYEFGEISREEYEKNNSGLNHKLKIANQVNHMDLEHRFNILG